MTQRNIRPKADKPLPVVDFGGGKKDGESVPCLDCDGAGVTYITCEACHGRACDDEGEPCGACDSSGDMAFDCATCDGMGRVLAVPCPKCEGTGGTDDVVSGGEPHAECPMCEGTGRVTQAVADGKPLVTG